MLMHAVPDSVVAREIARHFGIPEAEAARDVEAVRAQLARAPRDRPTANPITFRHDATGSTLCWHGQPTFHIEPGGRILTRLHGQFEAGVDLKTQLLWAAPHVLLLQHQIVLHASAVLDTDGAFVFCGPSGLGKTTLARVLAAHGRRLVAEDLVVLSWAHEVPEVVLNGESAIRAWAAAQAALLVSRNQVDTRDLNEARVGPRAPLREILFPRRAHLPAPEIGFDALGRPEALLLLLENSFAELGQRDLWLEIFEVSRRLLMTTTVRRVRVPEGLEQLHEAAVRYRPAAQS